MIARSPRSCCWSASPPWPKPSPSCASPSTPPRPPPPFAPPATCAPPPGRPRPPPGRQAGPSRPSRRQRSPRGPARPPSPDWPSSASLASPGLVGPRQNSPDPVRTTRRHDGHRHHGHGDPPGKTARSAAPPGQARSGGPTRPAQRRRRSARPSLPRARENLMTCVIRSRFIRRATIRPTCRGKHRLTPGRRDPVHVANRISVSHHVDIPCDWPVAAGPALHGCRRAEASRLRG